MTRLLDSMSKLAGTLLVAVLGLGLAACNDGGDASAAGLAARADSAIVAWNAPATIDVLANDNGGGTRSIVAATAGAHGTVAVVDGKLAYTPAAGYFGSDALTYTVAGDDGATTSASVAITVQARLRLSGRVATAAPLADANVTATVGAAEFRTTVDADGSYALNIVSARPEDFVALAAAGVGAQSAVKLTSLVGGMGGLAAQAGPAGGLTAASVPALDLSPFGTALAVLALRANGNALPANEAAQLQAAAAVSGAELLNAAVFVRMLTDKGVPLPPGVADTLALLRDRAGFAAFAATQLNFNRALYDTVRAELLQARPLAAQLDGLAMAGEQTLVYLAPVPTHVGETVLVTCRPDGTASVVFEGVRREALWTRNGAELALNWAVPDEGGFGAFAVVVASTGLRLRHHAGDLRGGMASLVRVNRQVYSSGPWAGLSVPGLAEVYGEPQGFYGFVDLGRRLEIDAQDVAVGARLAGVRVDLAATSRTAIRSDILRFDTPATGTLEAAQERVDWALSERWLHVSRPGGERTRYARLLRNEGNGLETWLAINEGGGADGLALAASMAAAPPEARFAAATNIARIWSYADEDVLGSDGVLQMRLFANGTAGYGYAGSEWQNAWFYGGGWVLDAQGGLAMQSYPGRTFNQVTWVPLKLRNGNLLVFERWRYFLIPELGGSLTEPLSDTHRVRWLVDLGPADR